MKENRYYLLSLLLLLFFGTGLSQSDYRPGYLITNNNDTLYGYINIKSNYKNSNSCEFKEKNDINPKTYSPNDIKAYRIENDKYYVSREVVIEKAKHHVFLEYLIDGIVDLYYLKGKEFGAEYYFVQKDTSILPLTNEERIISKNNNDLEKYSVFTNQYKGVFRYLFHDCPGIKDKIKNTSFNFKSMSKLAKEYHQSVCSSYECIDYTKSTKLKWGFEYYLGINNSWMGFETSNDYAYDLKPGVGINIRYTPSLASYKWDFLLGFSFSSNKFQGSYDTKLYGSFYEPDIPFKIDVKYSLIRIPITVDYTLPTGKIQPFFSLSLINTIILNAGYKLVRLNGTPLPNTNEFRKYQIGAAAGVGLKYNFKSSSYLFAKGEFELRMPGSNYGHTFDYQRIVSALLSFGYGFNLN